MSIYRARLRNTSNALEDWVSIAISKLCNIQVQWSPLFHGLEFI